MSTSSMRSTPATTAVAMSGGGGGGGGVSAHDLSPPPIEEYDEANGFAAQPFRLLGNLKLRNKEGRVTVFSRATCKWYCAFQFAQEGQCPCRRCDGRCGPTNGCQCAACAGLEVRYCGKRYAAQNECACGTCDGVCGPNDGCPCEDCFEHLLPALKVFDKDRWRLYPPSVATIMALAVVPMTRNFVCEDGHALFRLQQMSPQYRQIGAQVRVICNACSEEGITESLHCALCSYDLCTACETERMRQALRCRVPCDRGHRMHVMFDKPRKYFGVARCNACHKDCVYRQGFYHCSSCSQDLCRACEVKAFEQSTAMWPATTCPQNAHHGVMRVLLTAPEGQHVSCHGCEEPIRGGHAVCSGCNTTLALCLHCARQHRRRELLALRLTCRQNHLLAASCVEPRALPGLHKCDLCQGIVSFSLGYLRCESCDYDVCPRCAVDSAIRQPEPPTALTVAKAQHLLPVHDNEQRLLALQAQALLAVVQEQTGSDPSATQTGVTVEYTSSTTDGAATLVSSRVTTVRRPQQQQPQQQPTAPPPSDGEDEPFSSPPSKPAKGKSFTASSRSFSIVFDSNEVVLPVEEVSSLDTLRQLICDQISTPDNPVHPDELLLDLMKDGCTTPLHLPRIFREALCAVQSNEPNSATTNSDTNNMGASCSSATESDRPATAAAAAASSSPAAAVSSPRSPSLLRIVVSLADCNIAQWTKLSEIGRGQFGVVFRALNHDGKFFAAKEIELRHNVTTKDCEAQLAQLQSEIRMIRQLRHPNLVQYFGYYHDAQAFKFYVFMEFIAGGSLASHLKTVKLSTSQVQAYMRQLVKVVDYLHRFGIVHRDIKPQNVMHCEDGSVKLVDFGTAKHLASSVTTQTGITGSPCYMSPEVMRNEGPMTTACDIWSVGCTMVEMLTQAAPFSELGRLDPCQLMFQVALRNVAPQFPNDVHPAARSFLDACLRHAPRERPTAAELLRHEFLTMTFVVS